MIENIDDIDLLALRFCGLWASGLEAFIRAEDCGYRFSDKENIAQMVEQSKPFILQPIYDFLKSDISLSVLCKAEAMEQQNRFLLGYLREDLSFGESYNFLNTHLHSHQNWKDAWEEKQKDKQETIELIKGKYASSLAETEDYNQILLKIKEEISNHEKTISIPLIQDDLNNWAASCTKSALKKAAFLCEALKKCRD